MPFGNYCADRGEGKVNTGTPHKWIMISADKYGNGIEVIWGCSCGVFKVTVRP